MNSRAIEILVGLFMLLFLAAMLVLAMKVSNLNSLTSSEGYTLVAKFENIGGLKPRASVAASGVKVGQVSNISYDRETFEASVTLTIDAEFNSFPLDTTASIYTAGLLGEQYIGLDPGAEDDVLKDSDEITLTQSALVLERLIGQVLFSRSGGS
jgi:phospholipid/cholesterol/gamma-HCH transport system substrate-binding protein